MRIDLIPVLSDGSIDILNGNIRTHFICLYTIIRWLLTTKLSACGDIFYQTFATVGGKAMAQDSEKYDKTCGLHFCSSKSATIPDIVRQSCLDWNSQAIKIQKVYYNRLIMK